jgi:serine/threonine-protein kinase
MTRWSDYPQQAHRDQCRHRHAGIRRAERVVGDEYDGRVDVYSVGVMIYEMLTGHLPIENEAKAVGLAAFVRQATQAATPLRDWLPEVPEQLEGLIMRTLAREPATRPTAAELGGELRRLLERGSVLLRATVSSA